MSRRGKVAGHVFISYVREDGHRVDRLQKVLEEAGVQVWRDTDNLWPGQDWGAEIRRAITDSALVFIACFSRTSLARQKSYLNEELTLAIEQLRQRPTDQTWLIPVRLDDCKIPYRDIGGGRTLGSLERADLFGDRADKETTRLVTSVLRILEHSGTVSATARRGRGGVQRARTAAEGKNSRAVSPAEPTVIETRPAVPAGPAVTDGEAGPGAEAPGTERPSRFHLPAWPGRPDTPGALLVDDLVTWLVGLFGDASRRRLVEFVVGTAEKRALAAAAQAAVTGTAVELRPGDEKSAEQLAVVINQVFSTGDPRELDLAGGQTVQEALGVGVQVAVLGDPEMTGQEVSSADLLGIPAGKIAECLTAHLVAEIRKAALTGGPLKALADQINFDAAYLNDRRAAGVLDRVHAGVLAILERLDGQPVTVTAEEFASDVRALLEALAEQAARGRLPSYLWGRADVLALSREVKVRSGIRKGASDEANAASGQAYALAADRGGQGSETMPWPEAVAAHDRVVVLADAGLGKSWLIRTETRRLATTALAQADDDFAKVVIPVPLRCDQLAAAEGPDLPSRAASFLAGEGLLAARSRGPMTERIRAGRAVVLLDALDELTIDEAGIVRGLIESWSRRAGPQVRVRCMITSRIAGYAGPPLPDAAEVELQPFTSGDVTQVIRAWQLPAAAERELMGRASDPAVAAMARVPLLLVMLCALASEQPAGSELPRTRGELYERVLRWFLTRAHRSAGDPATQPLTDIQVEALLDLLAPIAFTFAASPGGWTDLMSVKDLFGAIRDAGPAFTDLRRPPDQVLTDLSADAGILVPDRDPRDGRRPRYLFLHRTFAEYLVARHLATRPADDYLGVIAQHQWFDPDWENVIAMFGGQLDSAGARQLIEHLLASDPDPFWHALLTAITVAGERPDADTTLTGAQSARLAQATGMLLRHAFGRDLISDRMVRVTHLPQCVREALLASLNDPDAGVRERAVQSLAGREDQEVTAALLARLGDPVADVRREAAAALGGWAARTSPRHCWPAWTTPTRVCACVS